MEDQRIVALYWERDEAAIAESRKQYGGYCRTIAARILGSEEDAREVENDTFLAAWNAIPPAHPDNLGTFLGMLCRRKSIDRRRQDTRQKRGGGQWEAALEELGDCLTDGDRVADQIALRDALERFLREQSEENRNLFLRRYWWFSSVSEIARDFDLSESAVKVRLLRTRESLRQHLEKEGFSV